MLKKAMKDLLIQATRDLDLHKDQPVHWELTLPDAWIILSQLQLALRHPGNSGPSSKHAERLARELEKTIAVTPAMKRLATLGWNAEYDEPVQP